MSEWIDRFWCKYFHGGSHQETMQGHSICQKCWPLKGINER